MILGVLSGPSIVTCFNSPDGMGQCLRGKMAEVGLVPAAPAPAVAEVEDAAPEVASVVEEAVTAEPELDVTPPADAAVDVDGVVAATFGLLRAEPDGSVVIAGSGTPGSTVEIFANGDLLGSTQVEPSGDWVFVPETPLPPGGIEITLGEEGRDGTAPDSFIVVINEDKSSQPLVVASKPGEASEVLQGLTAPTQVAAAPEAPEPATPTEQAPQEAPAVAPAAEARIPAADAAQGEEQAPTPAQQAPDAAQTQPPAAEQPTAPAQPADEPATAVAAAPEAAAPPAPVDAAAATAPEMPAEAPAAESVAEAPAAPAEQPQSTMAPTAPETNVATAPEGVSTTTPTATEPAPAAQPTAVAQAPLTIDAIEIENDRTFFAGAGPDGGVVRLYVDDAFIADATIEGGRWLIEGGPVLDKPNQRVRADLLQSDSAAVTARAEVDFVVDVPNVDGDVAVAETPAPVTTVPVEPAPVPAAPVPVDSPQPTPAPQEPASMEPAPATPAQPATPAPVQPADEPAVAPQPVAPAPTAEPPTVAAVAQPQTEAEPAPAVPTMVAVSLGDPDAQRFVSGKAIIRRGDNLWTIARRVYGEGLKYTTIYEANTGQIRDPDRIYPGQVFDLPEDAVGQ